MGGYGTGGWGSVAGSYAWTSGPLAAGSWSFAVKPYDKAGNLGTGTVTAVTIAGTAAEPAVGADGTTRLSYALAGFGLGGYGGGSLYGGGGYGDGGFGGGVGYGEAAATLTWQPSPT